MAELATIEGGRGAGNVGLPGALARDAGPLGVLHRPLDAGRVARIVGAQALHDALLRARFQDPQLVSGPLHERHHEPGREGWPSLDDG